MNQNPSTVLVIDDDHNVAELIACFLARATLRPVIALSGITGLQQAQALLPSLILCDSCMPGLDGLEVIERLRGDPATAHIPIVLMSGYEAERFDGSGADAFLQKPFLMSECSRWRKALSLGRRPQAHSKQRYVRSSEKCITPSRLRLQWAKTVQPLAI